MKSKIKTVLRHKNIHDVEVVRITSTATKEGYVWAVRDMQHNRMQHKFGQKAWLTRQQAIDAVKGGLLNVLPFEKLMHFHDIHTK